jgi:arabinofuranan 3-O-arabinosyltransferase
MHSVERNYDACVRRGNLTLPLWVLGGLSFVTSVARTVEAQGYDTVPLWTAVHALLAGEPVYTEQGAGDFLYPPSALVLLLPLGAFDLAWGNRLFFFVDLAAILVATAMLLELFGLRWRGLAGAVALLGLSVAGPVLFTLNAGNVNGPILLGLVAMLVAARRGSWLAAGLFLGATLALKPILAPLLVVLLLYRRWGSAAVAVAIPVLLSAPVLLAAPATRSFFDTTIPLLLRGQDTRIQEVSFSLKSTLERLSVPATMIPPLQAAVVIFTAYLLWRRWRIAPAEPRRLVELCTIVLVGTFLASSFSFPHYGLFLLPFAISASLPSSPHLHWLTWASLFCVGSATAWYADVLPERINEILAERFTFGLLLLLVSFLLAIRFEERALATSAPDEAATATAPDVALTLGARRGAPT